jgi:flagellar FliL protein
MAQEKQEKPEKAEKKEKKDGEKAAGRTKMLALLENKVLVLGVVVAVQAILAIAVTQFAIIPKLGQSGASAAGEGVTEIVEEEEKVEGVLVSLEEIIASLRGEGSAKSYVRTTISVEVKEPEMAKVIEERLAQLRDVVIMTVSQHTAAELTTPEGTRALRVELTERLGEDLPEGALLNIYFSDLMVQ